MNDSRSCTRTFSLWPAEYLKPPKSGACAIERLPDPLLSYIFELVHGEAAIPESRYQSPERLPVRSIIHACKRWYHLGVRVMLSRIHLEVGRRDRASKFRTWLLDKLQRDEALRTSTREINILFTDSPTNNRNRTRKKATEVWVVETLQLLGWWRPSLQKVYLDQPVYVKSAKRVLWQLAKMPLKDLCFADVSLTFFLKYFHFQGLKRLTWDSMGWSNDPEELGPLFSSEAPKWSSSATIAEERKLSLGIEELSISNPRIPANKLKLLFQACKSLRSFKLHYMAEMEDKRYTIRALQPLLDVQAESLRRIKLGHIFEDPPGNIERDRMIDFTGMLQLEKLSLNADNVYCLDPAYFATMVRGPGLQFLTIKFDSEAQYGVYATRLNQSLCDWFTDFAVAWSDQTQSTERKLCVHMSGGLDMKYEEFDTFDPTIGYVVPWPWDYLEAAKRTVAGYGIELTWTTPCTSKEEWRMDLLESWGYNQLATDERHHREDLGSEVESIEYASRMNVVKHDHDPKQRRLCQEFQMAKGRRICVH